MTTWWACLAWLTAAACSGPNHHLQNPGGHRVFVDGVAPADEILPFRYYGTTRWDALPADLADGDRIRADFTRLPASENVTLAAPVSPWMFPLDFPLELLHRLIAGRADTASEVMLPPTPVEQRVDATPPIGLGAFLDRARSVRPQR